MNMMRLAVASALLAGGLTLGACGGSSHAASVAPAGWTAADRVKVAHEIVADVHLSAEQAQCMARYYQGVYRTRADYEIDNRRATPEAEHLADAAIIGCGGYPSP